MVLEPSQVCTEASKQLNSFDFHKVVFIDSSLWLYFLGSFVAYTLLFIILGLMTGKGNSTNLLKGDYWIPYLISLVAVWLPILLLIIFPLQSGVLK